LRLSTVFRHKLFDEDRSGRPRILDRVDRPFLSARQSSLGARPSARREDFAGYVAQDAFFLESFARAYALTLARSSDTRTLLTLADLLAGVREELRLHASYAAS
jgi:thiaminase (transcriptional activator TenA)